MSNDKPIDYYIGTDGKKHKLPKGMTLRDLAKMTADGLIPSADRAEDKSTPLITSGILRKMMEKIEADANPEDKLRIQEGKKAFDKYCDRLDHSKGDPEEPPL